MNNELLLMTGGDIPFSEARINIHQPDMSEIGLIGEENFLIGCQLLNFSKEKNYITQDKNVLENMSDFEILMSIINNRENIKQKNNALMILALLFPQYQIKFTGKEILLAHNSEMTRINEQNFDVFKDILVKMFILNDLETNGDYNPIDKRAARIAEKLKNRKSKLHKEEDKDISIFSKYISILSVGLCEDINNFNHYTVYQLKNKFKRYQMKQAWDIYVKSKLAGAQDLEDVTNWMDDIHS